jgi:4-hydroxy-3-methylbut-2-enyl diphosphate reductase IspH
MICLIFQAIARSVKKAHPLVQSEEATGDVYILQGHNQHKLMICAYSEFLVHDPQLQRSIPITTFTKKISQNPVGPAKTY